MSTSLTEFRGPGNCNPGGKWYVKDHTAVSRDPGTLCCALCCDCSICCMICCPIKAEYIYQDPVTNKLVGEDGSIHPAGDKKYLKELKEEDLDKIRVKFGPPATMQRN